MKHIPNALSLARVVAAPYIFYLLWTKQFDATLIWFALAAATDALDGYSARLLNVSSRIGAYLDPIADKILLSGSFLTLAMAGLIPTWLAVLVLGRDVLILLFAAGALQFTTTRRDFPPSVWGKLSTVVQVCYVLSIVAVEAGRLPFWVANMLVFATLGLLLVSSVEYAWRALRPPQ
ncbi:MAG: CDP-alcohol phosphatidyltransferase family protein [Acidobacteriota bacterium]